MNIVESIVSAIDYLVLHESWLVHQYEYHTYAADKH